MKAKQLNIGGAGLGLRERPGLGAAVRSLFFLFNSKICLFPYLWKCSSLMICPGNLFNSLRLGDTYMHQWTGPSLIQVMVVFAAPSHYPNQCWYIVNRKLGNKRNWNFNQNTQNCSQENAIKNGVCKMPCFYWLSLFVIFFPGLWCGGSSAILSAHTGTDYWTAKWPHHCHEVGIHGEYLIAKII